jgi:threonine aldolase
VDDDLKARWLACEESFLGNGLIRPADLLASIDPATVPDVYGAGGVVADLESHVAELLGKPAAVFLPSGTMAQGITLRVHAERRGRRTVLWHPWSHLEQHEGQSVARFHDLIGRPVGSLDRLLTLADLEAVAERPAAVLWELPQRDLGGQIPEWADLVAQTTWARGRGAAVHLDGARLWEATAGYERTPAEIADLFDTVYVSFYKGVGALPGCCVAGPEQDMAEVREWRQRMGGTLFGMWPNAASALSLLPAALAEMPARLEHAQAVGRALAEVPEVRVVPGTPQVPMMHLLISVPAGTYRENARRLAEQDGMWVWPNGFASDVPDVLRFELTVGRATLRYSPEVISSVIKRLIVVG